MDFYNIFLGCRYTKVTAPKKRAYNKVEETSVGSEEPPEESHMLAPVPSENIGKFQDLRGYEGPPKCSQRQLCFFHKGVVDREGTESSR